MNSLTSQDIDAVCGLVNDLCGIYWDASKSYLIESRLGQIVQSQGCVNYSDLVRRVRADVAPALKSQVIDAVTTHETLWFRDNSPFEALKHKIFPELVDAKARSVFPKRFRIWSAACSTGQEPYSIAMTLADLIPDIYKWDVQILGTDISHGSIAAASRGVYNEMEVARGLDPQRLAKYFTKSRNEWRVRDEIRSMCNFGVRNLHDPFTGIGPFDLVFCRNVAIYFTPIDRRAIFERMAGALTPHGWILVGSSESLSDMGPRWAPQFHCRANCYRPNILATSPA